MAQPWKVLVYLAADNTLWNDALASLYQITAASLSGNLEIIVQLDGPSAQLATRYRCQDGVKELVWEAPDGYTADRSSRLVDFLQSAIATPAEPKRIFLVLWGHGAGLDHVYFYDTPNSPGAPSSDAIPQTRPATMAAASPAPAIHITPHEVLNGGDANRYVSDVSLARILDQIAASIGRKIDLVGFDACMMAMTEVLYEMRSSTAMIVASDEEVPSGSWPYAQILGDLGRFPGMDPGTLATLTVGRYVESYDSPYQENRVSLSVFDLEACGTLAAEMANLVQLLTPLADDGAMRRRILLARDSSRTPDEAAYIDLGVFLGELADSFGAEHPVYEAAARVLTALTAAPCLAYHRDAGQDSSQAAYGAAIYFPDKLAPASKDLTAYAQQHNMAIDTAAIDGPIVAGKKFPPAGAKFPPAGAKFPPAGAKFPPAGAKFPPAGAKFPPAGAKFPPAGAKFPPAGAKFPGGQSAQQNGPAITGYEILWDRYIELQFNRVTGWAGLIEKLIAAGY